jgi:DNA-binding MarR family transcriptional regulator
MPNEALSENVVQAAYNATRQRLGRHLETDEKGCLFDVDFREILSRRARMDPELRASSEAVAALVGASKLLHERFEDALAQQGITHAQFKTMMWIQQCGAAGTQLHQIATWLAVTPRNITGLVDALEAQGLVERVPDPQDRRAVIARLTPAGETRAQAARKVHERNLRQLMNALSDDELATLRHLSLKLLRAAGPSGEPANAGTPRPAGMGRSQANA